MCSDKTIIGIDPGTNILGYGVIRIVGGKPVFVDMGVVDIRKEKEHFRKLAVIHSEISRLYDRFNPDELAIESPFYGKNVQVILKLGRAQGVAIALAAIRGMAAFEYAPRKAKIAITGNGAASKEQVCNMIRKILGVDIHEKYLDATDALALAMCHYYQSISPIPDTGKLSSSWKKFLEENPGRIKR